MKPFMMLLAMMFALTACPSAPAPKPPTSDPDAGADQEEMDAAVPACARACINLRKHACPEAAQLDAGKSCYRVCADSESSGKSTLKPDCVATATTDEGIRACGPRCQK